MEDVAMRRGPAEASFSALMVAVGGLIVAVWTLFAIDMHMLHPLLPGPGMLAVVLISGAVGLWLHVRRRQLMGLTVSLLSALFLAMMSFTLFATFSVILLPLALLLVIGGSIALSRDVSGH